MGETSRSLYERSREHVKDGADRTEDSHIAKHWEQVHKGEPMPEFRFKIVRSFKDSLSRQVAESVRIDLRGEGVLNSKSVYSRNRLPRLAIEKTEWERGEEERKKRAEEERMRFEQKAKERREADSGVEIEDEVMMSEDWRQRQMDGKGRKEQEDTRPSKRRRVVDTMWGQEELPQKENERTSWLLEPNTQVVSRNKQTTLKPWSWVQIEARRVVVELVKEVATRCEDQRAAAAREQEFMENTETEIQCELAACKSTEQPSKPEQKKSRDIRSMIIIGDEAIKKEQEKKKRIEIGKRKKVEIMAKFDTPVKNINLSEHHNKHLKCKVVVNLGPPAPAQPQLVLTCTAQPKPAETTNYNSQEPRVCNRRQEELGVEVDRSQEPPPPRP